VALRKRKYSPILLISVGLHVALGVGIATIPPQRLREVVAIAFAETAKKEESKPPPPRSESPKPTRAPRTINAAARAPVAQVAASPTPVVGAASFQDIGIALDASSVDGLAVPMAAVMAAPITATARSVTKPKTLTSKRLEEKCREEIVKPLPDVVVRPEYTAAAREGRVEGRVRLELQVDEWGNVASVRVLRGLGYGLDEAALLAVKRMRFRPGTRCSKPVATPFVMAVRFLLET
jgi:periplasmic protein TonB